MFAASASTSAPAAGMTRRHTRKHPAQERPQSATHERDQAGRFGDPHHSEPERHDAHETDRDLHGGGRRLHRAFGDGIDGSVEGRNDNRDGHQAEPDVIEHGADRYSSRLQEFWSDSDQMERRIRRVLASLPWACSACFEAGGGLLDGLSNVTRDAPTFADVIGLAGRPVSCVRFDRKHRAHIWQLARYNEGLYLATRADPGFTGLRRLQQRPLQRLMTPMVRSEPTPGSKDSEDGGFVRHTLVGIILAGEEATAEFADAVDQPSRRWCG